MSQYKTREEIESTYKWDIETMFASDEVLEKTFDAVDELTEEISNYMGRVCESGETLLKIFKTRDQIWRKVSNLYTFTRMKKDEDNRESKYQGLFDRAVSSNVAAESLMSYIGPEILSHDESKVMGFLNEVKGLEVYRFYLSELFRQKEHTLSDKEERLLAMSGELAAGPRSIFTMLNNADIKFRKVKDETGKEIELTKGNYIKFLESPDQTVRADAFAAFYESYKYVKNTVATTLIASFKKDAFYSKMRQYPTSLERALDDDFVPTDVYNNLIGTIHNRMDLMHEYVSLRKKMLKLDELHMYDLYTPLVGEVKRSIPYKEAREMVSAGLKPLGEDYLSILKEGFESKWIDVYETEGKTSGAYSWGTFDSKPFVLLNYQDNLNYVFTLAHEMGHSIHSYLSKKNQDFINSNYKIFVAEVASTVNESILMQSLLKQDISKKERMFLLNHFMEQFKGTVYRQTMFAEFEKLAHGQVDDGQAVTMDSLSEQYYELNKAYFGDHVVVDDDIRYEWMRIPHFYNAFYVYKYATGFSAAIAISQRILKEGQPAIDDYMKFLKSGGSDHPIELLKIAGVDMTTPQPIEEALSVFEGIIKEMNELIEV